MVEIAYFLVEWGQQTGAVSEVSTERQSRVRSYFLRCERYLLDMPQPRSLSSFAEDSKLRLKYHEAVGSQNGNSGESCSL